MSQNSLDKLYKKLFDYQLTHNWGKVIATQEEISRLEDLERKEDKEPLRKFDVA